MKEAFILFRDFSKRFMRMSNLSLRDAAICWRSKELDGKEEERGAFVFALESIIRILKYLTLDLLSIINKHSRGILSRKFPPAAESRASRSSSHVRIDLGGSLSSHIHATPSNEKGKRGIDSESEEIEDFLNDDSIQFGVEDSSFNMDKDILFFESLLTDDPIPPRPIISNQTKLPIKETNHLLKMGYEHFNTNLVTNDVVESSTKNLVPIPRESKVTSENGSKSIEPVKDESLVFTTISNPLFDNDKINFDELNSHVESISDESTSNHDTVKFDNLDEFPGPLIPIHIVEEERIRREHADYINRMEMLFTINPRPHPLTYPATNVESFSSLPIPIQDSDPHQEEIDVVTETVDVLPLSIENDDSDGEVDAVDDLCVDNSISNSEHDYSESEDSDFDNLSVLLPPLEPPDKEFDFAIDFGNEISIVRNAIVKFECIDARIVFNDDLSYFMFVIFDKMFSLLSAESEDTIFDH
nr:hypothetical protein [Tanacetum cinerariifolium]